MDYILNGTASGDVANQLMSLGFNPLSIRPYVDEDGREYVDKQVGGKKNGKIIQVPTGRFASNEQQGIVGNADTTLTKDEWQLLDRAIIDVVRDELTLVNDLRSRGLQYQMPNGMGHTVLQHQTRSDIGPATVSMDGIGKSDGDRPVFGIHNLPLPIIHKDFDFTLRELEVSRRDGSDIDTTQAEVATRKVLEEIENLLVGIGDFAQYQFGGGTIYGLTNYPNRLTYTMTTPTGVATADTTVNEVLEMRQNLYNINFKGPFILYYSPGWDEFLDNDYSSAKGSNTLRERIMQIRGIQEMIPVDYLTDFQMLMVQPRRDVIREVIGMEVTPVRWTTDGGMRLWYKVMAIMVPQLRADHNSRTGILHATAVSGGSTTTTTTTTT